MLLAETNPVWLLLLVATTGNTLGGALSWWMGLGAHRVAQRYKKNSFDLKALDWLRRLGPKACLLAWLPLVGDPLCSVAGWLKMPFWPCVAYMAIGKFLRYTVMTIALIGLASLW